MIRKILLMLCVAAPAAAHDFWLEPSTFRPVPGQTFTISLLVGQDFTGDVIPRNAQLIDSFTIRDGAGEHPVNGFENQDPAGYVRLDRPGCAEIGYRSKANPLELSEEKFNEFVRQEGINVPLARGPHREHFFRYAKAIVGGDCSDRALGYRFEIVLESVAAGVLARQARGDARLYTFRILFEGKPLAGALVTAMHRDDPNARLSARSNAAGRVQFALPESGVWLVKSVHMVDSSESLWASLTFER